MELWTTDYTHHNVDGAIIVGVIMGTVGIAVVSLFTYIYFKTPVNPQDTPIQNAPEPISEVIIDHSDVDSDLIINSILEGTDLIPPSTLLILVLIILILILIYYFYRKYSVKY